MISDQTKITLIEILQRMIAWQSKFPSITELQNVRGKSRSNVLKHLKELQDIGILVVSEKRGKRTKTISMKKLYELMGVQPSAQKELVADNGRAATAVRHVFTDILEDQNYGKRVIRAFGRGTKDQIPKTAKQIQYAKFLEKKAKSYNCTDLGRYFNLKLFEDKDIDMGTPDPDSVRRLRLLHKKHGARKILNLMDWFIEHWATVEGARSPSLFVFTSRYEDVLLTRTKSKKPNELQKGKKGGVRTVSRD
jgi:DNA-binding transcriptional regulator GbsR (MarR family)